MVGLAFPLVFFSLMMLIVLVPTGFWIYSLVEAVRAPDAAFGPPWDNAKNAWIIGLAVAFVLPAGTIVASIVWWTQGHKALRGGARVPRPFWAPAPSYPPQPYPPQPPGPPEQLPPS